MFHLMWIHKSINCSLKRLEMSPLKRVRTHRDVRRSPNQHFFPHFCSVKPDRRKVWKSGRTSSDPRPFEEEYCASVFAKIWRGPQTLRRPYALLVSQLNCFPIKTGSWKKKYPRRLSCNIRKRSKVAWVKLSIVALMFFIYIFQLSPESVKWKWQMSCWCLATKFEIIKRSGNGNESNYRNRQHRGYSSHRSTATASATGNLFVISINETTNSPIYEYKVLHKDQRAF